MSTLPSTAANEPQAANDPLDCIVVGQALPRPRVMSDKACAALLDICPGTWRNLVRRGEAPKPVKLGRLTKWRVEQVEAYIARLR